MLLKCKPALLILCFCFLAVACTPKNPKLDSPTASENMITAKATEAQTVAELDADDDEFLDELDDSAISISDKLVLIKPCKGNIVSSPYGMRRISSKKTRLHAGVDILGKRGENIIAPASGTVISSGRRGAYGLMVDLDAGNGVILRFAHMEKIKVKAGQKLKRGQLIGHMGRTGRATAYHLHFEVRVNNKPKNPMQFIAPEHRWAVNVPAKKTTQASRQVIKKKAKR